MMQIVQHNYCNRCGMPCDSPLYAMSVPVNLDGTAGLHTVALFVCEPCVRAYVELTRAFIKAEVRTL